MRPQRSLADALLPLLRERFPDRGLRENAAAEFCAIFPAAHGEVGDISIQDDGTELTVYVGNFTHLHFSYFENDLSPEQKTRWIVEEVVQFLDYMFADRVIMWGSHRGGGGLSTEGAPGYAELRSPRTRLERYVWSGPLPRE